MVKDNPNLFKYATSELSQDAFICWLLEWANKDFEKTDDKLHQCAVSFVHALFKKDPSIHAPSLIKEVKICKQHKNIDVLCFINNEYIILIEDKTDTKNHSKQLVRYYDTTKDIAAKNNIKHENILLIYFKTGDQDSYKEIEEAKYKPFLRKDFLEVLERYTGENADNAILLDYRMHLQTIQASIDSYLTLPIEQWGKLSNSWIGFYMRLQQELGKGNWGYVSNPSDGFFGFWWHYHKNCCLNLQLEEKKLCFKITVKNEDKRSELRDMWHKRIMDKSKEHGLKLNKPKRFGWGECMTVCVDENYMVKCNDGLINVRKTVENLKKAEKVIQALRSL